MEEEDTRRGRRRSDRVLVSVGVCVLLAVTTWAAFFFHFYAFGLYEDDYCFTGYAMGMNGDELAHEVRRALVGLPSNLARPLGLTLPLVLSYAGNSVAGLRGVYVIAFAIVVTNTILMYHLLRRFFGATLALFGALVFCLFPADTTKALLTHALQLQMAMLFMLVASLLWLSGKRVVSYVVIVGTLLTYESAILPFFLVPFLQRTWDKRLVRAWALHVLVLVVLLGCGLAVRTLRGEPRAAALTVVDCVELVWGMGLGPVVSASSFGLAPVAVAVAIFRGELSVLLALLGATALFFFSLRRLAGAESEPNASVAFGWRGKIVAGRCSIEAPPGILDAARAFAVGLVMMPLAYAMAFTHFPGFPLRGRSTSVHLAATFAAALLFGSLLYALYCFCRARRLRTLGTVAIAAYLASLVAYGMHVQRDFVRSWDTQRRMFTSVVQQCPDLAPGTLIFVEGSRLWDSPYVKAYSWSNPIVLEQLFRFPDTWNRPPRLFVVSDDWASDAKVEDGRTMWFMPHGLWKSHWAELPEGNLIVFKLVEGELVRSFGPVRIAGTEFALKQIPPGEPTRYEKGHLYDYLVSDTFAGPLPMR